MANFASASRGASTYPGQSPVVQTDKGAVRGEAKSMVTSFKGIPFAAPPTGDLRWKAPQPAARWKGHEGRDTVRGFLRTGHRLGPRI